MRPKSATIARFRLSLAIVVVIFLGLASRRYPWLFPAMLGDYPGDALWATSAYLGVVFVSPSISLRIAAAVALAISFGVEFSQLYHAPWIDSVRDTTAGRLVLGSGFDPVDLAAYVVGVVIGGVIHYGLIGLGLGNRVDVPASE